MRIRTGKRWSMIAFCAATWVGAGPMMAAAQPDNAGAASGTKTGNLFQTASTAGSAAASDAASDAPSQGASSRKAASKASPSKATAQTDNLPRGQSVKVGAFGRIDLHVKDLALTKVLQLLSIQSQRNIIASKNVSGNISADLYDVNFYDALDAVLHANGYGYQEKGQFIYVYTAQEMAALKKAQRKAVTRIVHLNYISAELASQFVSPLLSDSGDIVVSGKTKEGFKPSETDAGSDSFAGAATLVLHDYQQNIKQIMNVLKGLDVRPKQVLVKATILSAKLTENNAFGVDLSVLANYDLSDFVGSPLNLVDGLISGKVAGGGGGGGQGGNQGGGSNTSVQGALGNGGGISTGVGNTSQPGGFKVGILTDHVSAFVRALDSVTDTTVIARPKLLVLNRQKADLLVGGRVGYLSTTATETASTQTVEFLDIGTQLTLRPFVSDDNMIRLELRPSVSDATLRKEAQATIPDETTQELTTNVIVHSGQTVILGGLFKKDTTVGRRQVPGLGGLPVIGNAFKGQDDQVTRSEVIFMIQPTVIKDKALYAAGERAEQDVKRAAFGARQGLLPWSRSKLTAAHISNAMKYADQGKTAKARWEANLALDLNPTSVDALRLKQKLTGEKIYYQRKGIIDQSIDQAIQNQMRRHPGRKTPHGGPQSGTPGRGADRAMPSPDHTDPAVAGKGHPQARTGMNKGARHASRPSNDASRTASSSGQAAAADRQTGASSDQARMDAAIDQAVTRMDARRSRGGDEPTSFAGHGSSSADQRATVNVFHAVQKYLPGRPAADGESSHATGRAASTPRADGTGDQARRNVDADAASADRSETKNR